MLDPSDSGSSNMEYLQCVPVALENLQLSPGDEENRISTINDHITLIWEHRLKTGKSCGEGAYGKCVEVLDPSNPNEICVFKKIKKGTRRDDWIKEAMDNEIKILKELVHPNIINIKNIVCSKLLHATVGYITEKARTDLYHYIMHYRHQQPPPTSVEPRIREKIVFGIFAGIDYLHLVAKVIHGDLNPNNILIKGDFDILICDFGAATKIGEPSLQHVGTDPFRCREQYLKQQYSTFADIHSFGMTIYFLCSMKMPFEEYYTKEEKYAEICKLLHGLNDGLELRPNIDPAKVGIFKQLFKGCVDPLKRWPTKHVKQVIDELRAQRNPP